MPAQALSEEEKRGDTRLPPRYDYSWGRPETDCRLRRPLTPTCSPPARTLSRVSRGFSPVAMTTEGGVESRARPDAPLIGYEPALPLAPSDRSLFPLHPCLIVLSRTLRRRRGYTQSSLLLSSLLSSLHSPVTRAREHTALLSPSPSPSSSSSSSLSPRICLSLSLSLVLSSRCSPVIVARGPAILFSLHQPVCHHRIHRSLLRSPILRLRFRRTKSLRDMSRRCKDREERHGGIGQSFGRKLEFTESLVIKNSVTLIVSRLCSFAKDRDLSFSCNRSSKGSLRLSTFELSCCCCEKTKRHEPVLGKRRKTSETQRRDQSIRHNVKTISVFTDFLRFPWIHFFHERSILEIGERVVKRRRRRRRRRRRGMRGHGTRGRRPMGTRSQVGREKWAGPFQSTPEAKG